MKLMLFDDYKLGVLRGDRVVDVTRQVPDADRLPKTPIGAEAMMENVIENFEALRSKLESMANQEGGVPVSGVRIRPPLPRPPDALCAFSNYQDRDTNEPRMVADSPYELAAEIRRSGIGNVAVVRAPYPDEPELVGLG